MVTKLAKQIVYKIQNWKMVDLIATKQTGQMSIFLKCLQYSAHI